MAARFGLFLLLLPLVLLAFTAASCGSSSSGVSEYTDPDVPGRDANPDGVPYPTDHLGGNKHVKTTPGDRIPNMTFQAYVDGDHTKPLQTVSLADYFDPQQKRYKLLHIEVAATWCTICSSEIDATEKVKDTLRAEGIVYLEVIVSGPSLQRGPSLDDVTGWIDRHSSTVSTGIDVRARRLSAIGIDGTVMPWDLQIDTRTMEILDSSGGAPNDIVQYDRSTLQFIETHAPAY
jgi:hypothetical protein